MSIENSADAIDMVRSRIVVIRTVFFILVLVWNSI
jgi:hypothetical protein